MKIRINKKEVLSGSVLLLIGGLTVLGSLDYTIGSLARMGPGYFPLAIGVIIMILGFFAGKNMAQSKDDSQAIEFPAHSIVLDAGHAYDQQVYGVDREEVHL